eukprot:4975528-Prymnesium_polylepis.2
MCRRGARTERQPRPDQRTITRPWGLRRSGFGAGEIAYPCVDARCGQLRLYGNCMVAYSIRAAAGFIAAGGSCIMVILARTHAATAVRTCHSVCAVSLDESTVIDIELKDVWSSPTADGLRAVKPLSLKPVRPFW